MMIDDPPAEHAPVSDPDIERIEDLCRRAAALRFEIGGPVAVDEPTVRLVRERVPAQGRG